MVYLKSEAYNRFYLTRIYSCATLFCVVMYILAFTVPFLLAFSTRNIWLRETYFTEQPLVAIREEMIIYALQEGETRSYSTVPWLNRLYYNPIGGPSFSAVSIDSDFNGKPDEFKVQVTFQGTPQTTSNVQIYLFFDYGLRDRVKLQMQDYVRIDVSSQMGIQSANVVGNIRIDQQSTLRTSDTVRDTFNISLFTYSTQNLDSVTLANAKQNRNTTIWCECDTFITPGLSPNAPITINIDLFVPQQERILYTPSIWENLKLTWILYFSYFIPIYLVVERVMLFAYRNKIFGNKELNDVVRKKGY